MHLINVHILGAVMLVLWAAQWGVMIVAPGGFPREKPCEGTAARLYNFLNMFTVVILMPSIAALLITGFLVPIQAAQIPVPKGWPLAAVEVAGMASYLSGHVLLSWARFSIGESFQMGGVPPRQTDGLVVRGAYRLVRHPMYTALLGFDLGLALITQSAVLVLLFAVLLIVVVRLVPVEERQLETAYGDDYVTYQRKVKALLPLVY